MKCKFFQATLETTEALKIWVGVGKHRAAGKYFIMVRTDPLEMDPLAPSSSLQPTNLPPHIVYHSNFNFTEKSHT